MKQDFPSPTRRRSRVVALVIVSPALLAFSGCGSNCDSTHSTLTTSDDCGNGSRTRGGAGYFGGGSRDGSGSSVSPGVGGSARGGFGRSGGFFSGGS